MKVAIDARTLGSRPSGVGMYLNDFLKQLIKYKDIEFVLISDVAESEYIKSFKNKGIEVYTQGKKVYRSAGVYSYFSFVKKQLDMIKPDIFWEVNTIIPIDLKGNYRTMITIHDMFPIEYVEYFGRVYNLYFKHNLKKTLKHTDMILYNSEQTKRTTEKYFPEAKQIKNVNAYIISNPVKKKWVNTDGDYFLYIVNLEKHIENLQKFDVPVVVTLNSFITDTEEETAFVRDFCEKRGCAFALSEVWEKGGQGGVALAETILDVLDHKESHFAPIYPSEMSLKDKIATIAKEIYGAADVSYAPAAEKELAHITELGMGDFPVCMAKTQYSLSDDAKKLGRPEGFTLNVREVYASAGAGFVVVVTGAIMTMPGLPKKPAAFGIDVSDDGVITGLF